ncbi:MAG: tripartite tricarboxylate transporter TctB family protein [Acetobacterales bacterium]
MDDNRPGSEEGAGTPASSPLVNPWDLLIAAIIVAICAVLWFDTFAYDTPNPMLGHYITAAMFPRTLMVAIIALTLLLPFENHFLERQGSGLNEDRAVPIKPITCLTALLLFLVVWSNPWLGTYLAMVAACIGLPLLWGERRLWLIAIYAAVFPALVGFLFVQGLLVSFLPGITGHIFR